MENDVMLSIQNISKRFGGTQALDDVSFDIRRGEVHALLGENGAGKSTLIKIISGVVARDKGTILFDGQPLAAKNPQHARTLGINVVYQELSLVPGLSVAENICASNEKMNTFRIMKTNNLGEDALRILEMLHIDPKTPVKALGIGAQQMVEIAGAISRNCKLLVLDEPTASLTNDEIRELYKIMHMLKEAGVTMIYISHKLSEVFEIADRVTVLKDGKYVATQNVSDINEQDVVHMMIGRELNDMYPPKAEKKGEKVLEVRNYAGHGFNDISFDLHQGEILGFAGLSGAGRTEFCTALFGTEKAFSGQVKLFGKDFQARSVKDAMAQGIGYLPENRKEAGVFMQMSIKENTVAATLKELVKGGLLDGKKAIENTNDMIDQLNTKVGSIDDGILSLSGGNQQKIVLARWLLAHPRILIVDEPTRGIDVGAKYEIYQILRKLANNGMAIILISSELPETIGMSDRVIAVYRGKVSAEVEAGDPDIESKIGRGIMGLAVEEGGKEALQ
ncbi:MAG: sugar ABC transporter ATP-binding protein [Bacillota bacterium]|nr:sugar ABC transporter ATP-binding protein [Bacillota bacterium]